jgi:hypothetical protein
VQRHDVQRITCILWTSAAMGFPGVDSGVASTGRNLTAATRTIPDGELAE